MNPLFPSSHTYDVLENEEDKQLFNTKKPSRHTVSFWRWTSIKHFLATAIIAILSFAAGYGFLASRQQSDTGLGLPQLSKDIRIFQYNRTFPSRPTNETNRAWTDLFPQHGGYFEHPVIAPSRSAFAVFHQVHCLDAIRQSYWLAFDAAATGQKKVEEDYSFMTSPSHVRHCIDLIRNALMCQPDLTLEIKDEAKGGVTGFGVEHRCINWESLVNWVSEWES